MRTGARSKMAAPLARNWAASTDTLSITPRRNGPVGDERGQLGGPPGLVGLGEPPLALADVGPAGVVVGQPVEGALDADELGPVRLAVLVEPVGVDEPGPVVGRGVPDRVEEGPLVVGGHGRIPLPLPRGPVAVVVHGLLVAAALGRAC